MNYYTEEITEVTPALEDFISQCTLLGYKNNSSLKEMRWDWCLQGGMWYATYDRAQHNVVCTGIHPFKNGYRALYRGAQLRSTACERVEQISNAKLAEYMQHLPLTHRICKR